MKNYTPIAMKCNKEQFEAIKPKLKKACYIINTISDFKYDKYLVNDFNWEKQISNISFDSNKRVKNHYKRIKQWDEKIFLEACGIETKPTYQITKETILKYNMKDEFPDVFEVKLEVGKWYKCNYTDKENKSLIFVSDISGKNIDGFGFDFNGKWFDKRRNCGTISEFYRLATTEEVEEALKNEAVKRYKKGDIIKCIVWEHKKYTGIIDGEIYWASGSLCPAVRCKKTNRPN